MKSPNFNLARFLGSQIQKIPDLQFTEQNQKHNMYWNVLGLLKVIFYIQIHKKGSCGSRQSRNHEV